MIADGVFEGGGVKGIGLVGAVCRLEEEGFNFKNVAGTSAGAIVAALIAAGYRGKELKNIILNLDYTKFQDTDMLQRIPLLGKPLGLIFEKGMYRADYFEKWLQRLLSAKGKRYFKDISENGKSRLKVIASDVTTNDLLILPDELERYGIDPMTFPIARAVRMSMSIPFYFTPVKLRTKEGVYNIVDGGLLSDYPVWLFDTQRIPSHPTFGLRLVSEHKDKKNKKGTGWFFLDVIKTILSEDEERYIKNKDFIRTIPIESGIVGGVEFDISKEKSLKLFNNGYEAAERFLDKWDFGVYIEKFRRKQPISRTDMLWK